MTLRRHSGRDTTHINLPSGTVSLETVLLPGGMVTATDTTWTPYAWVQDRLGNVRGVVDMAAGTVVERSDYYAFGSRIASDPSAPGAYPSIQANRWRYAGKEEQAAVTGLSLDDFGARMYDPFIARWMTVDPLGEKYYSISPYAYCAGDPVNLVDPEGMDIWSIDSYGNIVAYDKNEDMDAIYLVTRNDKGGYDRLKDEEGNDLGVCFKYGTIEHQWSRTYNNEGGVDDIFVIRGDDNGRALFEFLADNVTYSTGIEYSQTLAGIEGDKGLVFVSSSHTTCSESSFGRLYRSQLSNGYTIRQHTHSHPNNIGPRGNDISVKNSYLAKLSSKGLRQMDFYIYYVGSSQSKKGGQHYHVYTKY